MDQLTCCEASSWVPERDLGHAEGFEYLLGRCARCGTPWINAFCVATGLGGYELVAPGDLATINSTADPLELKEAMRRWGRENIG